jgi:RNA polymerase sigma-70 factor (ECF subfamily)
MHAQNCEREATDSELMQAVSSGDADAMAELYRRYESTLRAVILSVLHEGADVGDVLNDVFLQLWHHANRFAPEKRLHGFLVTIARRRALDRRLRRLTYHRVSDKYESELKAEFKSELRSTGAEPANADLSRPLKRMIGRLPKPQQEVVHLTFFEGMSQREIAARRSIALGTVKTRSNWRGKNYCNCLYRSRERYDTI